MRPLGLRGALTIKIARAAAKVRRAGVHSRLLRKGYRWLLVGVAGGSTTRVKWGELVLELPVYAGWNSISVTQDTFREDSEFYALELIRGFLQPGMVFLDLGAHCGIFSLVASLLVGASGKVYALEPDPNNYRLLKRNVELNGAFNIIPVQAAVGDCNGTADFWVCSDSPMQSSLFGNALPDRRTSRIVVDVVCLDDYLAALPKVDVIKMDVEGAELAALKGMQRLIRRSKGLKMFCELNPKTLRAAGADAAMLVEELDRLGFRVGIISEKDKSVSWDRGQLDEVIGRRALANLLCCLDD